jgi:hypothetical protein
MMTPPYTTTPYLLVKVDSGSGTCLSVWESFSVITCLTTLNCASLMGGIWCLHVSHGSESRLPAREGSGVATCRMALASVSSLGRASVSPRVALLRTLPPR